jgi:Tfp pilus assembly major pilin PilA
MIVVAIIGLLAAIAIPSFTRYLKRSRTIEAGMNIRKLYDSAVAYHGSDHADANGNPIGHQWPGPVSVAFTPALGACCASSGQRCSPDPTLWTTATWAALNFAINDGYSYSYWFSGWQFGTGELVGDKFFADASADLNCNGTFSLFRRQGSVAVGTQITGGAALYTVSDLE